MQKNQKIILFGGIGVLVCLIALIIVLIASNSSRTHEINEAEARADSLRLVNDQLQLSNEFNQLNAEFSQYEDQQVYLKNDSLVQQACSRNSTPRSGATTRTARASSSSKGR